MVPHSVHPDRVMPATGFGWSIGASDHPERGRPVLGLASTTTDLARIQFATTSIYHFLFVPVTIGLAFLVAILQTAWYRTDNPEYKRMTRFFGTLLLINVAIGVVTGLVQEFEFGMNWSTYSRFVGGVFGAPLAMEGLAAFFLESTFLGLWLFGWDRLPKRVHLATIWAVSIGSMLSAMFILIANSWMQHPVGYKFNKAGQPVLSNVWALFVNPTFLWGYAHVILASLITGALVMLAVSAWHLRKQQHVSLFQRPAKVALIVLIPAIVIQLSVGNQLGLIETKYQPMKIAAAEALWDSCKPCSFSVLQVGGFSSSDQNATKIIPVPHLLSVLGTGTWSGPVSGLNQLQAQYQKKYGPGNYIPNVAIQYWSMRTMAYLGSLILLFALWGGWLLVKRKLTGSRLFLTVAVWAAITPFLMNTAGWLLTESGRQPWIVQGLQLTVNANSPAVSATDIWISLIAFILAYTVLGAADAFLMFRYSRRGLAQADAEASEPSDAPGATPALTY
jgi:cytochrome d ubiquinol oxidase subunit I